jgi:hypothetical protein
MFAKEVAEALSPRLVSRDFTLTQEVVGGPMGSALFRFSSEIVNIDIQSDREKLDITVGPIGDHSYGFVVWAKLLGVSASELTSFDDQIEFFMEHLDAIIRAVRNDRLIDERLRDLNWVLVKEHLGLDPDQPRPGAST